ncbi:MAG: poly-gamma-glutamate system protein [Vicinamibacterales bacterium]
MRSRLNVVRIAAAGMAVACCVWVSSAGVEVAARVRAGQPSEGAAQQAQAERLARQAMHAIRLARDMDRAWRAQWRLRAGHANDPDRAALIGDELTPLVTTLGHLEAKWLSTDSRWASALVRELNAHGVEHGDVVAASFSGSFPGLNLSLMAACKALGVQLVAVSSVTASTWGANEPGFTWPEMEVLVVRAGVLPAASVAIGIGGSRDAGRDLEADAQALARRIQGDAARQLQAHALNTVTLDEAIVARMDAYDRALAGRRPAAYVNIGGNHASLGGARADLRHAEGWHHGAGSASAATAEGTIAIFRGRGVPALNLLNVVSLAREWGVIPERALEARP